MSKYGLHNTPNEVMKSLAAKVSSVRKEQKFTQKELSERSGVAYASVMKYELTGIISLESFLKICWVLGRLDEFDSILTPQNIGHKESLFDI